MRTRIAVVDDEPRVGAVLAMVLRSKGRTIETFTDPKAFCAEFAERPFDLVLTDLKMPGMTGVEVLEHVRATDPSVPVILVTAHATVETAVAAIREGAYDYVQKPFENDACRVLVDRALEHTRLQRENRAMRAELRERFGIDGLVAESVQMQAALDLATRAAKSNASVLITGESGTGKEVVARAVHFHSPRVGAPFVAVNCKALSPSLVESELFGHERGAFTGAVRARPGLFERADGGTLFLDEIGEVGPEFQAKLLRVLQEREVRRVGGDEVFDVDVRVIAASNRDLLAGVADGSFREDLYYRLAVIPVHLPPLRERPEDVIALARLFVSQLSSTSRSLTRSAQETLASHAWPGNVRELLNVVERAVVLCGSPEIDASDLMLGSAQGGPGPVGTLSERLDRETEAAVREALAKHGGVRQAAAAELGVERTTLYRLMKKFGLGAETGTV